MATKTDPTLGDMILDSTSTRPLSPPPNLASGSSAEAAGLDSSLCLDSSAELSIGGTGWPTSHTFVTLFHLETRLCNYVICHILNII